MGHIRKLKNHKVLSISSATGWNALFAIDNCEGYIISPLACWALIESEDKSQMIVGVHPLDDMAGELGIADFDEDFMGFKHDDEEGISGEEIKLRLKIIKGNKESGKAN